MSDETPVSYAAAVHGSAVLSSSGTKIGTLEHVLEVPDLDIFDGIVLHTHHGLRFIEADRVTEITRSFLQTDLDDDQVAALPAPDGPPVYHVDVFRGTGNNLHDVLGRFFGRPHWTRDHD